jgi:hypothetical protein
MFEVPPQTSHFALFFTQPPPPGYGAAIYHQSRPGTDEWTLLGYLTGEKPSAIYRLSEGLGYASTLGIDIEPVSSFPMLPPAVMQPNSNAAVVKVLESLYNYVMSFTGDPTNQVQAIPIKLFNDWYASMMKRHSTS